MYIQIDNAGFHNKGAELMLQAVLQRIGKEKELDPHFVKGILPGATPELIRRNNLFQIAYLQKFKIKWQNLLPNELRYQYGLVREEDVHCLMDAGGFQFGDQWVGLYNKEGNAYFAAQLAKLKKRGTKLVYLPQAFGPFTNELSKEKIQIVHEYADLIYARENISLEHLKALFGDSEKVRLAPDFTCLVEPDIPLSLYRQVEGRICIIPNNKMVTHTSGDVAVKYLDFLISIASNLIAKGERLLLLNHEDDGDWQLILRMQERLKATGDVIALNNLNALAVKAVIGHCKLLLSSRFHGVVSGLNQGVPTFCTSWSHKYQELLKDYGVEGNLLDVSDATKSITVILEALNQPEQFVASKETIKLVKEMTEDMWKEIIRILQAKH